MVRCPSCGAHREESDDYCPVCGETLTEIQLSEATGPPWYERTGLLLALTLLVWPVALYGLSRQQAETGDSNGWLVTGCIAMAVVWSLVALLY